MLRYRVAETERERVTVKLTVKLNVRLDELCCEVETVTVTVVLAVRVDDVAFEMVRDKDDTLVAVTVTRLVKLRDNDGSGVTEMVCVVLSVSEMLLLVEALDVKGKLGGALPLLVPERGLDAVCDRDVLTDGLPERDSVCDSDGDAEAVRCCDGERETDRVRVTEWDFVRAPVIVDVVVALLPLDSVAVGYALSVALGEGDTVAVGDSV